MQIQLNQIKQQESTAGKNTYLCKSNLGAEPGQYLKVNDQIVEILFCRTHANEFQWLIQTSENLLFDTDLDFELKGERISFAPLEPIYLFAEESGVSIALHWLDNLRRQVGEKQCRQLIKVVVFHTPEQFNFRPTPSTFIVQNFPSDMIAAVPLLEDLGIPSRLCTNDFQPGCFEGNLIELIKRIDWSDKETKWLGVLSQTKTAETISAVLGEAEFIRLTNY